MNAESKVSLSSGVDSESDGGSPGMRLLRLMLMVAVPVILLAAGAAWYLAGGGSVSTDNAYIKADMAAIAPEVAGTITVVHVTENQPVGKGQPLLAIDDSNYRVALAGAEAQLRTALSNIAGSKARYRQKQASLALLQNNVVFAEREFQRQSALAARNFSAAVKLDEAKHALDAARQNIALLKQEEAEILASLEGDHNIDPEKHPSYLQALTSKTMASTYMGRSTVVAPFDGVVSQVPSAGDYARTGAPVMSIVASTGVWIEANFKETDLTGMKPGQSVKIQVATYPKQPLQGRVTSISQATGAEFSVLPAQNSSGNWVKVVQRIPVRISVDDQQNGPILRAGMSADVTVETGRSRFAELFQPATAAR